MAQNSINDDQNGTNVGDRTDLNTHPTQWAVGVVHLGDHGHVAGRHGGLLRTLAK